MLSSIVQGKGYPDLNTRRFVRQASNYFHSRGQQSPPVYCLVDCDPDGLAILKTYKYGSVTLAHENADTVLPSLEWAGISPSMLFRSEVGDSTCSCLSERDRAKATTMLGDDVFGEHGSEPAWRNELQRMMMWNVKAEIQILDRRSPDDLKNFLNGQIERRIL